MSSKTYREGVPEAEAIGTGEQKPEQVWTVYYTVQKEVNAESWFKAVEAAEKLTGLPRTKLRVEMGNIKGENVCSLCKHIHVQTVCDCGCRLIPLKP